MVVLPPPDRPTSPSFVPAADGERKPIEQQRLRRRMPEADVAHLDAVVARRERNGRADILNRRRIQQQIGELRGVGQRALEVAIDPVELPHHPRGRREVAEREEDGLQARRACRD